MKKALFAVVLLVTSIAARAGGLSDLGGVLPSNYFHLGFNQIAGGVFYPVAGAVDQQSAGFITPAVEHDAADGSLLIPGISYNPLNLGYKGSTANFHDFMHGSLEIGPSLQTGELVKSFLRGTCSLLLPQWGDNYGALKAVLAPGSDNLYADVGLYAGLPMAQFGDISHMKPSLDIGATLVKKFGGAQTK